MIICCRILVATGVILTAGNGMSDPLFENVHAVPLPKGDYGYRGTNGDFVQLKDGSILYVYTQNGISGKISSDVGKTWSDPFIVVPALKEPARGNICHPSLLRLPDGHLLLSYIYSTHPTTPYYGHNYYRRSADEGKTWTDPFLMTPQPGYAIVHNDRISLLPSGRILAMAEYKAYYPSEQDHSGYVAMSFFSDDNGTSWQASKNTVDMHPMEVQEADAVALKDGRILLFARTYSGHPVKAYSEDNGQTWSKGEVIQELQMPSAGLPTVRRIPSTGDLLFIWISERCLDEQNPKIERRCALSSAISKDEGQTFTHIKNIMRDPQDDFGYQCVEFVGKDLTLIGFHKRDGLHVARIGVDWFYGE